MGSDAPSSTPTLDPLGTVIYYLCVTEALKGGSFDVPSSHKISKMLKIGEDKEEPKPVDPRIDRLWNDLQWVNREGLLFREPQTGDLHYLRSFTPRALAPHNVNIRIQNFHPGFELVTPKHRRIVTAVFVDRTTSAVRLVALKDLYYFSKGQLPQKLLLEFLQRQNLTTDANEYYRFLKVMHRIRYVAFPDLPPGEQFSDRHTDQHLLVEPAQVFRNQDMYLELRALDFFLERESPADPRAQRKQLRKNAEAFMLEKHPLPRALP